MCSRDTALSPFYVFALLGCGQWSLQLPRSVAHSSSAMAVITPGQKCRMTCDILCFIVCIVLMLLQQAVFDFYYIK